MTIEELITTLKRYDSTAVVVLGDPRSNSYNDSIDTCQIESTETVHSPNVEKLAESCKKLFVYIY